MRIPRSAVVGSAAIAAVLIGISSDSRCPPPSPPPARPRAGKGGHAPAGHGTGHEIDPRIIARGKATFAQYCANCHGDEGKGDGIAGQNLPIKPQNLTEGGS